MIVILTILTANYLPVFIWLLVLFCLLACCHFAWRTARQAGYDLLAFYASYKTTQTEAEQKRVKLEVWRLQAQAQIQDRRLLSYLDWLEFIFVIAPGRAIRQMAEGWVRFWFKVGWNYDH